MKPFHYGFSKTSRCIMFQSIRQIGYRTSIATMILGAGIASVQGVSTATGSDDHWAFQPIVRPTVPFVRDPSWPRGEIDRFILARLEREGIRTAAPADRPTLLRRVTLDLMGLPPTVAQVEKYLSDHAADAYEQVVDRLLSSPQYGERWARHWLDVARYADSAGHEFDTKRPIWRYRDWVIEALNQDLPYDQFLIEQLAGDLLPDATREQIMATGFSCNALKNYGDIHETTIDRVNAFGTAYLGLTLGCAQCHDHKSDPITQQEYYQIYAFFNQAEDAELGLSPVEDVAARDAIERQIAYLKLELSGYQNGPDGDPFTWAARLASDELRALPSDVRQSVIRVSSDRTPEQIALILAAHRQARLEYHDRLQKGLDRWWAQATQDQRQAISSEGRAYLELPREGRPDGVPPSVLAAFWKQEAGCMKRQATIKQLEESLPEVQTTLVLKDRAGVHTTHVFLGGDHRNVGPQVTAGVPQVLPPLEVKGRNLNRLDLAEWVASRNHPLTARVAVNRIWQRYFGAGLAETSDNFGVESPPPSHPALLDWLAAELMDHDWSLKHIHRLIVTSATYRQSSHSRPELKELDPQNRLLARQTRLRLEAEVIRDGALAASGLLDTTIGGPSVFPYQPEGIMTGRADGTNWQMSEGTDRYRRGLYTHFWRLTPHPFLKLFDAPDAVESCTRRTRSNSPIQALALLNGHWFNEAALALAQSVLEESSLESDGERIDLAFAKCLARRPTTKEQTLLGQLLQTEKTTYMENPPLADAVVQGNSDLDVAQLAAWTGVSRALLNLDEFITRE